MQIALSDGSTVTVSLGEHNYSFAHINYICDQAVSTDYTEEFRLTCLVTIWAALNRYRNINGKIAKEPELAKALHSTLFPNSVMSGLCKRILALSSPNFPSIEPANQQQRLG